MGNSLRCCISCMLPCGALDLIRIVHLNGHVEELTHPITAGEILQANPHHVLTKPSSQLGSVDVCRIVVLSPDSELKRGGIYFLIPDPSLQSSDKLRRNRKVPATKADKAKPEKNEVAVVVDESKSKSSRRNHRRSRGQISSWTPHLERICEDFA